ncbi:MAG: cobalamin-binding protein [Desulfobacterales bacterium]|nr:cobalamin-binding protein [Desulfobacterales bacterium]
MRLRIPILLVLSLIILFRAALSQAAVFEDALGRVVSLKTTPKKIVSLAPSLTEILYYLGLEDRIAGVTRFSYYPPEATDKAKVGTYNKLNVEKIISLGPDLAIGTVDGNEEGTIRLLEQAGIAVYLVNPRRVRDAIGTIATLGELCGVGKKAAHLCSQLNRRIDKIVEKTSSLRRPLVFLQINVRPIMTVNRNTIHHDVIRLAGGVNMTQDEPITYPRISVEAVLERRPEVIIISSMERRGKFERERKKWLEWPSIPAAEKGRIHLIESDLLDRPSPRIVEGLEAMAGLLHPGAGWEALNGESRD